jgi:hypothetical protein
MNKNKWYMNKHFWGGFIACAVVVLALSLITNQSIFAAAGGGGNRKTYDPGIAHDPNGADQTAPSVVISAPVNGYTVDASTPRSPKGPYGNYFLVPLNAYAADDVNLAKVASFVNGSVDTETLHLGSGFNDYTLNGTARVPFTAGTYVISVRAWDTNGNLGETSVSVTVPKGMR